MPSDSIDPLHNYVVESKRKLTEGSSRTPPELPPDKYLFCNHCKGETHHTCKADYYRHFLTGTEEYLGGFMYTVGYRIWMCIGCEACTLEEYYTDEAKEDENGNAEYESEYFPQREEYHLRNKRFMQLPARLSRIYNEVIVAHNNAMPVLCSIGIRTLIEGICADQEILGKNLEAKINGLATVLPQNIVSNLHSIRFIGNEAAHELNPSTQNELRLAIEICEDLLNYLYELDYKANHLAQIREQRKSVDSGEGSEVSGEP